MPDGFKITFTSILIDENNLGPTALKVPVNSGSGAGADANVDLVLDLK